MIAKLASISRWTERAKGAALVAALAVAVASGYAFAISPTVNADRDFVSAVTVTPDVVGTTQAYVVPAGHQYTITDVTIANDGSTRAIGYIYVPAGSDCSVAMNERTNLLIVPAQNTLHLALNTGISFAAGKTVCATSTTATYWTLRGYLSN